MSGRPSEIKLPPVSSPQSRGIRLLACYALLAAAVLSAQGIPPQTPGNAPPSATPAPQQQSETASPAPATPPIAIVPLDATDPAAAASVTGPIKAENGRALITSTGDITAGTATAQVTLPYRGTLNVCANTSVKISADTSVPASEVPGLLIALESGALEASFAIVRNSDIVQTPDFRILISGPGSADVKVRLGPQGDTCVDNAGPSAPYVLVSSVFEGGAYRVQPGQRVMFQHGSLREVVDNEKEPCGCPPNKPRENEFPLAQSEGLQPIPRLPPPAPSTQPAGSGSASTALVYKAPDHAPAPATAAPPAAASPAAAAPATPPANQTAPAKSVKKKPGFFSRVGRFFKRAFGAD